MMYGNLNQKKRKMMTTINHRIKFLRKNIRRNFIHLFNLYLITFLLGTIIFVFCKKEENLKVESIKTNNGWGYAILNNDKIIIKQTIVPAVSQHKSFQSEKEALAVGQLVVHKLKSDLAPTITKRDLVSLKIKI
jgi:uncharacterized protein YehS (DUF1456 family)